MVIANEARRGAPLLLEVSPELPNALVRLGGIGDATRDYPKLPGGQSHLCAIAIILSSSRHRAHHRHLCAVALTLIVAPITRSSSFVARSSLSIDD